METGVSNGEFSGNPCTEWLSDKGGDRDMRVIAPFWYRDPAGRRWDVPSGTVVNGASIPRTLWSSVGSPFTGNYRRAALVHDAAVGTLGAQRAEADTMFYFACLCGGCAVLQSKLLYAGVRLGTWAASQHAFAMEALSNPPDGYRLPGQQSPHELELRARYTLLAHQLRTASDDFDAIRQLVDRNLGAPPGP